MFLVVMSHTASGGFSREREARGGRTTEHSCQSGFTHPLRKTSRDACLGLGSGRASSPPKLTSPASGALVGQQRSASDVLPSEHPPPVPPLVTITRPHRGERLLARYALHHARHHFPRLNLTAWPAAIAAIRAYPSTPPEFPSQFCLSTPIGPFQLASSAGHPGVISGPTATGRPGRRAARTPRVAARPARAGRWADSPSNSGWRSPFGEPPAASCT